MAFLGLGKKAPTITITSSSGGFIIPTSLYGPRNEFRLLRDAMPFFAALRGGIDWSPPHVRWARQHERELRAARKMWDWPRAPMVAR